MRAAALPSTMTPMDPADKEFDDLEGTSGDRAPSSRGTAVTVLGGLAVVLVVLLGAVVLAESGSDDAVPDDPVPDDLSVLDPAATAGGLTLTDAVEELPEFTLTEFGGDGEVPVADFLGGPPLVINFWATWCAPCVAEMPDFQTVHEAGGEDFRLLGINTQDAEVNAEPFVEELGITYDLAVDRSGEYFTLTGGFGMPTTLFVTPDGVVVHRHTGPLTLTQMTDLLAEHLDVQVDLPQA